MDNPTLNVLKDPRSRKLEEIYARIPKIECQRKCQAACGVIHATGNFENERIDRQFGLKFGRHFVADKIDLRQCEGGWIEPGRPYCEFVTKKGTCDVYALRPLMCRLFGVTRELACPHGCIPERWLDPIEQRQIICDIEAL